MPHLGGSSALQTGKALFTGSLEVTKWSAQAPSTSAPPWQPQLHLYTVRQSLRKFYITAKPFPGKPCLCHLFIFQACSSSLIFFFFFFFSSTSSSSVLSLVNNAYRSRCYADRQRQVVYQRIKLYSELRRNSCNLVPCG